MSNYTAADASELQWQSILDAMPVQRTMILTVIEGAARIGNRTHTFTTTNNATYGAWSMLTKDLKLLGYTVKHWPLETMIEERTGGVLKVTW